MKKILVLIMTFTVLISLAACSSEATTEAEIEDTLAEISAEASYDGRSIQLGDAEFVDDFIRVSATYTNDEDEPSYALSSFAVKAYQNDKELDDCSDINGDEDALIYEVYGGTSVGVYYKFQLVDDSDVRVVICEPTAEAEIIGEMSYEIQ